METRFRRYLTLRRLNSEPAKRGRSVDDLDVYSVPYETTPASPKQPIFISQPLRRSEIASKNAKDDLHGLSIRAFSYDTFQPGKPPVLGGRPFKGNGPVKLQTNRRLSSGELLATCQDSSRTLEDIREGDYIVGRKEKRHSQLSQVKTGSPVIGGSGSPTLRGGRFPSTSSQAPPRSSSASRWREITACPTSIIPQPERWTGSPTSIVPETVPGRASQDARNKESHHQPSPTVPMPPSPGLQASPTSLLTKGEEQNSTIQALWKAEYARLVSLYGQDGVDRNIAELNRDRRSSAVVDVAHANDQSNMPTPIVLNPLPKPSFDAGNPPASPRNSRSSFGRISTTFDDGSDYSSLKPASIMSSEESSSSFTKRTSVYEPDLPTTREDVRRIVDSMRSNYLKAIETKTAEDAKAKSKKKKKSKAWASLPNAPVPAMEQSFPPFKTTKAGRQSWSGAQVPAKKTSKRTLSAKQPSAFTLPAVLRPQPSKTSMKSGHSLQRADSLTLGALVPPVPKGKGVPSTSEPDESDEAAPPPPNILYSSPKRRVVEAI